ncbi:hypothetical protein FRC02_007305, partial [Tulasnella sp. 418]
MKLISCRRFVIWLRGLIELDSGSFINIAPHSPNFDLQRHNSAKNNTSCTTSRSDIPPFEKPQVFRMS